MQLSFWAILFCTIFYRFICKSTGGITMKNALGVSLGITALIWTYLALNVIPGVLVWAGFIAVSYTHLTLPTILLV